MGFSKVLAASLVLGVASSAYCGEFFTLDTGWFGGVHSLNNNGTVAVGSTGDQIFRWRMGQGMQNLGAAYSAGWADVSDDGNTVSGTVFDGNGIAQAGVWREGQGWQYLGGIGAGVEGEYGSAWGMSGDGSRVVGLAWHENWQAEGFSWTDGTGMVGLGTAGTTSSRATAISRDGSTIVGFMEHPTQGYRRSVVWVNGVADLIGGDAGGEAMGVNSDGSVVVGQREGLAYVYANGVMTDLGVLAEHESNFLPQSYATAVSDTGVVVGWSGGATWFGDAFSGFVWSEGLGMVSARTYLESNGVFVPDSVELDNVTAISADGTTLAGYAYDTSAQMKFSWVARLDTEAVPEPASMAVLGLGALVMTRRRRTAKR